MIVLKGSRLRLEGAGGMAGSVNSGASTWSEVFVVGVV